MRASEIPPHLHERYGITPPSPWRWVVVAAVVIVTLPVALYAASRYVATQSAEYSLVSWAASSDTDVTVTWKVKASAERQWCALRAQDFDHVDVGFAIVPVSSGTTDVTYLMHTNAHPVAVDVFACDTDPYELPGASFAPGVLPPAQELPGIAPGIYTADQLAALQ